MRRVSSIMFNSLIQRCSTRLYSTAVPPLNKTIAAAVGGIQMNKRESELPSITSRSSLTKVLGKGAGFADYKTCKIQSGHGGDGAISFQKAPAQEIGPPAGGNGGRGGDVYLLACKNHTSLNLIQESYNVESGR